MIRLIEILIIALIIAFIMILIKYKMAYRVTIAGEEVGYITSRKNLEERIENEIINPEMANVAYVDIATMPEYYFLLVDRTQESNEEEIFAKIQAEAVTTYRVYGITVNQENKTYVNTQQEAEEVVAKIKEENADKIEEIEIGVNEIYTQDLSSIGETVEVASAVTTAKQEIEVTYAEQERVKSCTLDGVYFSVKPVSGNITSRFGANESIRDHTHKGMDIAAPSGTPIQAAADGEVTYSGWMGGYGNLIIITHANGIQTYYGHCSKLYASEGDVVAAGDTIAAVGSTGNSTGNHLHFEIRKNGEQINPQIYLYQ